MGETCELFTILRNGRPTRYQFARDDGDGRLLVNLPLWLATHGGQKPGADVYSEELVLTWRPALTHSGTSSTRRFWQMSESDLLALVEAWGMQVQIVPLLVRHFPDAGLSAPQPAARREKRKPRRRKLRREREERAGG